MARMPGVVLWSFDGPLEETKYDILSYDQSFRSKSYLTQRESTSIAASVKRPFSKKLYRRGELRRLFLQTRCCLSFFPKDADSDGEQNVFHDAPTTIGGSSSDISGPTPKSSLQKVGTPSSPPITPPTNIRPSITYPALSPPGQIAGPSTRNTISEHVENVVQRILRGGRHSATFEGTSQYAAGGSSACGLASMNAIRLAFELCARRMDPEQLVSGLISEEFVRAAMGIATYWPNDMHLEVEPILQLPLFSGSIRELESQYAESTYRTFANAVRALRLDPRSPGPRAVCMTRPPEVIGVINVPIPKPTIDHWNSRAPTPLVDSIYLVFDSHPRPNHPNGAAVQIFPSRSTDDVADYLMDLFQVDQGIFNDPNLEWTAQLLGQVSCHILAPSLSQDPKDEYALNMRILEANRKCSLAEDRLKTTEAETRKLRSQAFDRQQEIAMLHFNLQKTQDELRELKSLFNRPPPPPREEPKISSWFSSDGRGGDSSRSKGKGRDDSGGWLASSAPKEDDRTSSWSGNENKSGYGGGWNNSFTSRVDASSSTRTSGTSNFEFSPWSAAPLQPPPSYTSAPPKASGSSSYKSDATEKDDTRSLELALRLQQQFDNETVQFSQGESLAKALERPKFDCGICMETYTDEAIARIDGCGHFCCRDCMRSNIESKIEERRYPIPCPFCVAGSDDNVRRHPGVGSGCYYNYRLRFTDLLLAIPFGVVETIGISPELFNVYTELQLAEHSIMIDCRR
ncbi:hypothetical protein RSOLAG1IB_11041 [Rhizoctonia solani AG-1 IB]|uniref:RING-type domain-containing protein n=1 Tax=Thanatephorus cucumeris (strain AG1-IB / isolate 7/3/14) TaxID=1108050 RepID=A0A0B7G6E9_THACB|nr:hypothetical protein RSOLAG1IB_11041 [Rhizoctonia solani AG-1 IB]